MADSLDDLLSELPPARPMRLCDGCQEWMQRGRRLFTDPDPLEWEMSHRTHVVESLRRARELAYDAIAAVERMQVDRAREALRACDRALAKVEAA